MEAPQETPGILIVSRSLIQNSRGELLLVKRTDNSDWAAGQWEFPGGKFDAGDDLSRTREREVLQEVGLLVEPTSPLTYTDSFIVNDGKYKGLPFLAIYGLCRVIGGKLKLSDEHSEHAWAKYDRALDYDLTAQSRKALIILASSRHRTGLVRRLRGEI